VSVGGENAWGGSEGDGLVVCSVCLRKKVFVSLEKGGGMRNGGDLV